MFLFVNSGYGKSEVEVLDLAQADVDSVFETVAQEEEGDSKFCVARP